MSVVKGLFTALLGLLLFISFIIFGTGLMLNTTLLNADWVSRQAQKLDISETAREFFEENFEEDLPAEIEPFKDEIYTIIDEYEPWFKEQLDTVINSGYAYMKGQTDHLSISINTVEVKASLKDRLWTAFEANADEFLVEIIGDDLTSFAGENIDSFIDSIPPSMLPAEAAGLSDAELKAYIDANLDEYLSDINVEELIDSVMPQIEMQLDTTVKPYFDEAYNEFMTEVPDVFVLDESEIPADVMEGLHEGRKYLGYFQTVFYAMIGVIIVLSLLIFAIHRNLKGTFLSLGIVYGLYGLLQTAGLIIGRTMNPLDYVQQDMPSGALSTWAQSIYTDMYGGVFMVFSIAMLVIGVAMIVVALVVKRGRNTDD